MDSGRFLASAILLNKKDIFKGSNSQTFIMDPNYVWQFSGKLRKISKDSLDLENVKAMRI